MEQHIKIKQLFAVPAGPDSRKSLYALSEDGRIFVNTADGCGWSDISIREEEKNELNNVHKKV